MSSERRLVDDAIRRLEALVHRLDAPAVAKEPDAGRVAPPATGVPESAGRLMDWLRADLGARAMGLPSAAYVPLDALPPIPAAASWPAAHAAPAAVAPEAAPSIERRDRYRLDELLEFHDDAFLAIAYRAILRRDPDIEGQEHYGAGLREGRLSRVEVLGELRHSAEGRAAGVEVQGLGRELALRRWLRIPVLGRLLGIARYVFQLPRLAHRIEQIEDRALGRAAALRRDVERQTATVEASLRASEARTAAIGDAVRAFEAREAGVHSRLAALRESEFAVRRWSGAFGERLVDIELEMQRLRDAASLAATREELSDIGRLLLESLRALGQLDVRVGADRGKLALVDAGVKQALLRLGELGKVEAQTPAAALVRELQADHSLDDFYARFEDRFRGETKDIKSRVRVYVPLVRAAYAATGEAGVVDIGCGRGEWLEVLAEAGIRNAGADANLEMVQRCRARGLEVVDADGLNYLRSLEADSRSAVSAFHVIEHLAFRDLITLFDEALRVLRPGGVIVFETPNPENLIVGACNFWYDPTHVHPLPPEMVRYIAEARGFVRTDIMKLHPFPAEDRIPARKEDGLRSRMNELLYGPRDYSIVAYKP